MAEIGKHATSGKSLHCSVCGDPTNVHMKDMMNSDKQVLCEACTPHVKRPRVTLFGAPDGQELRRWQEDGS